MKKHLILLTAVITVVVLATEIGLSILRPELFHNFDWYGKVTMALLITLILGLLLRSYASVKGTYLTYQFQLTGGIVIFCLVFATSFTREIFFSKQEFGFTVQIQNYNPTVMPEHLEIYFLKGTYNEAFPVDENGIAYFHNIPSKYLSNKVKFQLTKKTSDNYSINENTSSAILEDQGTFPISLERQDFITGTVIDSNHFTIDSASVKIQELDTVIYSDIGGFFRLKIAENQKRALYHIFIKKGTATTDDKITINTRNEYMLQDKEK
jgi:hypothetical protein